MRILSAGIPTFAALVLTLAPAASPAADTTASFRRTDYASAAGARGVTTADFNRDGWIDIAIANHSPDGISVLLNQHGAGFTASFIPQAGGPFDITTGDLNGDGLPDLVVANADGNMINVAFGLESGGFRTPLQIGAMGNPRGVAVADMDRDGNQDIIYTQYYFAGVQVLYGDGKGNFDSRGLGAAGVGPNPQGVAVADFNLDGQPDIAVAASGGVGLTILTRHPVGNYSRQDVAGAQRINVLTVGDFNADGRPDIAAASSATSEVFIYLNTPAQGFVLSSTKTTGASPRGIAAVDVNRDGALDLVTGNRGSSSTTLLMGDGMGGFSPAADITVADGGRTVAVADFDNDGRPDVAIGNEYAQTVTVLSNVTHFPASAFGFTRSVIGGDAYGYSNPTVGVSDFDLDGKPDAVTQGARGGLRVIYATGSVLDLPTLPFGPADLAAGHVNGDGYPDIIYLDRDGADLSHSRLEVYIGAGRGGFPAQKSTLTGINARQLKVADLNRDGRLDAVLLGSTSAGDVMQVWLGAGDGTFMLASHVTMPERVSKLTLGDVDRDGDLDVVTAGQSVTMWPNDGTGHFGTAGQSVPIPGWYGVYGGDLGDVNHDGYLDFVGGGSAMSGGDASRGIVVLLGGADGFAAPSFLVGDQSSVRLADLTLDGNLDIVNDHAQILPGNGDGTFGAIQAFDAFVPNFEVVDFNRDGLPDIVAPDQTGLVQVLLNQRGDTNTAPTVDAGTDFTIDYGDQFGDGDLELWATGRDAELHRLTYTWTDDKGTVISSGPYNYTQPPVMDPGRHEIFVRVDDGRGGTASDSVVVTIRPAKEVVTYVARADAAAHGSWGAQSDSTAASGFALRDTQADQPKVTTPLANPSSYVDIWVLVDPTMTYKLWVRLKATNDYWANDSLWLQFANAVDQNGNTYAPGTTSGLAVNLEECSGCGDAGWGWRDDAWGSTGAVSALTLRFTSGGYQRVRIQTREDGVSIDQLVLSAEKYQTVRPGAVKSDATILPATIRY